MSSECTDSDRPNFEPSEMELMGYGALDHNTSTIVRAVLKVEKKVDYSMGRAEKAFKMAKRHDKILSPVAAIFVFLCSAAGLIDLIVHWTDKK